MPLLRELAIAIAFSPSLSVAVENEYVQPVNLEQTDKGVTMRGEYVIVDQKQLNVFYTLRSADYSAMDVFPSVANADDTPLGGYALSVQGRRENGSIRNLSVDFMNDDMLSVIKLPRYSAARPFLSCFIMLSINTP